MAFKFEEGIPKGRVIPVFLSDEGDVYPIYFKSMDQLEMCGEMVAMVMERKIAIDVKNPINPPNDKIRIFNTLERKMEN